MEIFVVEWIFADGDITAKINARFWHFHTGFEFDGKTGNVHWVWLFVKINPTVVHRWKIDEDIPVPTA